jgi:Flp pilus assembly protein CpaB
MKQIALAAMAAALLIAGQGAALADTKPAATQATPAATAKAPANPDDKVICKYQVPTGSRLGGHRVCMTKAQWTAQANSARDAMTFRPSGPSGN